MTTNFAMPITLIKDLDQLSKNLKKNSLPGWFTDLQKESLDRFETLGIPTIKDEEWKYTNLSALTQEQFASPVPSALKNKDELKIYLEGIDNTIVFVNGFYSSELTRLKNLPSGVTILPLKEALKKEENKLKRIFNTFSSLENSSLTALNIALNLEGIFINISKKTVYDDVIHIVHVTESKNKIISQPRSIISLEEGSEATVFESHLSYADDSIYLTNALTDIFLAENAVLHYSKAQKESTKAFHIGTTRVWQERNSNFDGFSLMVGGGITRNNLDVILNAEGTSAILNGLYCVDGMQHVDNHTSVDHRAPNCTSNQLYKGILKGSSRGVFNGKIFVRAIAQKTNSYQLNKNLLLGKNSRIDTKPQLEIFADDVKCTHGATIGQLDEDEIFYLQSRAIDRHDAVQMLCHGFVDDIIHPILNKSVRTKLKILVEPTLRSI